MYWFFHCDTRLRLVLEVAQLYLGYPHVPPKAELIVSVAPRSREFTLESDNLGLWAKA